MNTSGQLSLPEISIIIVTYNAAGSLQDCLNSIFRQRYPYIGVIVIDGGSTDGTVDILEKNNTRITFWRSEPDEGIYDAMNKGLRHVSGEWVYFLGADDLLLDAFSDFATQLKDPNTIYYGSVIMSGRRYLSEVNAYRHAKTGLCHQSVIYPASVFKRYSFDTRYKISADHVLNMQCWKDPDFRFEFRDYIIANFNDTGVSSLNKDKLFEKEHVSLVLKHYGIKIWLRFLFRRLKAKLAGS